MFKTAGVNLDEPAIFLCNHSIIATFVMAAAVSVEGKGAVSIYDGAWTEYSKKAPAQ